LVRRAIPRPSFGCCTRLPHGGTRCAAEDGVGQGAFSPDGTTVLTVSDDETARLWEVGSGQELRVLRGHEAGVGQGAFSPDGKTVLTVSTDGTARIWGCDVCGPFDEIAQELRRRVGRTLTDAERQKFGITNDALQALGVPARR
jgi:hypothetical protein